MEVPIYPSLPKRAEENATVLDIASPFGDLQKLRRELSVVPNKFQGYKAGGVEYLINDDVAQIRPTDLLNVMAIGGAHVPLDETGSPIQTASGDPDLLRQWTTPAEALGIAFGYTAAPASPTTWKTSTTYGPLDYYYFDHPATGTPKQLFDSGYLRTDDFVPTRFDSADNPYTVGTGAPIAGNILTVMRTQPESNASLTMAATGMININTAPTAVLRLLPFVFPSKDEVTGKTFWIGPENGTTLPSDGERETEALKTDIAAMIESYRDKIAAPVRPGARTGANAWFAPFFDRNSADLTSSGNLVKPNDPVIGDLTQAQLAGGRYWSSGIKGIREGAGFRSVGEMLALRNVTFDAITGDVNATSAKNPSNIDFMGYRAAANPTNLLGTDNIVEVVKEYDSLNKTYKLKDIQPLQFGHTYQDKLKILSGLLGSVTVRSDMYAVWFIARGYQRSDCEGLPDLQPMVPTVERRFLMIIDRSNVTKIGQKPRVLAFVEVPL